MRTILLTGFEPFAGEPRNPAGEIAAALDGLRLGDAQVASVVLPVDRAAAWPWAAAALEQSTPAAVVSLGLAREDAVIRIERIAVNVDDYSIPDASDQRPVNEPIEPDGPAAYRATIPAESLVAALRAAGVPARVSHSAGTYLCNHVFYRFLHAAAQCPPQARPRVTFVHVPPLPECVAQTDNRRPSMALETTRRAVEVILHSVADRGRAEAPC